MSNEEKITLLRETLFFNEETIAEDMSLSHVKEWDSVGKITFMAMVEDRFNRILEAEEVSRCRMVKDLLDVME